MLPEKIRNGFRGCIMKGYDLIVIGGGPAGMASALAARRKGIERILIIDREVRLGGILNQCIHNGFGLHIFKEELTGPEYSARFISMVEKEKIDYMLDTMVMDITEDKIIYVLNRETGYSELKGKAIILAMGCRERPRGALMIPGSRCSGILTAGTAQKLVNLKGYMPGKEVVILGSGDIGLIMARRMTLEGAKVKAVVELMPYSSGLKRNIVQCLQDYDIPLYFNHTVTHIHGMRRLEGVTVGEVDTNRQIKNGTKRFIACDTLLLSVGLLPENELSKKCKVTLDGITGGPQVYENMETMRKGIFACGNVLHVHDLVDNVTEEGYRAGEAAAEYILNSENTGRKEVAVEALNGVRYTVPQYIDINSDRDIRVHFRVDNVYKNSSITVNFDDQLVLKKKRKIMTPGGMEEITISQQILCKYPQVNKIRISIEGS